ncbi:hypothetical protein [Paraburkholderia saeva]|uniref:hypothetical protein n=1 Tax=Paraburkholderia saeva TaxID=2777537 RepID=UPI001E3FD9FE|nr:hypothetical protein [Paraburkholderia saeva]
MTSIATVAAALNGLTCTPSLVKALALNMASLSDSRPSFQKSRQERESVRFMKRTLEAHERNAGRSMALRATAEPGIPWNEKNPRRLCLSRVSILLWKFPD